MIGKYISALVFILSFYGFLGIDGAAMAAKMLGGAVAGGGGGGGPPPPPPIQVQVVNIGSQPITEESAYLPEPPYKTIPQTKKPFQSRNTKGTPMSNAHPEVGQETAQVEIPFPMPSPIQYLPYPQYNYRPYYGPLVSPYRYMMPRWPPYNYNHYDPYHFHPPPPY